jgi:uncharacterized membrane protein
MEFQRMMNKKGMQFKNAFFSLVVVSMAVIAIGVIMSNWNAGYGTGVSSNFGVYDVSDTLQNQTLQHKANLGSGSPDPGENSETSTYRGVYGIMANIYTTFNLAFGEDGMIDSAVKQYGLPDYVRQGLVTLIMAAIAFSLIAVIFRLSRSAA